MYGWRARMGVILSPPNTVCEPELNIMAPPGVSIHVARMFRPADMTSLSIDAVQRTNESLPQVANSLGFLRPNLVVFPHTMGSMVDGPENEDELTRMLSEEAGCPALTTAKAMVTAFKLMGLSKISVANPYPPDMTNLQKEYLEMAVPGLQVVKTLSLDMESGLDIGDLEPSSAYKAAKDVDDETSEAVFLSGTNWRTIEMIESLEKDLGKPVITANQVTMWAALRMLGIGGISGYGKIFSYA